MAMAKNVLAAQNATAAGGVCFLPVKNVPLRFKRLCKLRKELQVLALPLLKAVRPDAVWTVQLTNSAAGPGR
jgi:hypothetical protein